MDENLDLSGAAQSDDPATPPLAGGAASPPPLPDAAPTVADATTNNNQGPPQAAPKHEVKEEPERPTFRAKILKEADLADEWKRLLTLPVYQDEETRRLFNETRKKLQAETGPKYLFQRQVVDDIAAEFVEIQRLRGVIEAAIERKRMLAAREIICPDFTSFYPPPHRTVDGTLTEKGASDTAFGEYMEREGRALVCRDESTVIADAKHKLSVISGQDPIALSHRAYVLALPEIERLEALLERRQKMAAALVDRLVHLLELADERAKARELPAQTSAPGKDQ